MRPLRFAAELLAAADSLDGLTTLVAALGCDGTPAPLDGDTRAALGIPSAIAGVRIVRGPGTIRALLVELPKHAPARDILATLATRLASRAPHLLWLVAATQRGGTQLTLAVWSAERSPPRLSALACDRGRVVASDAETVCALAAVRGAADVLMHARWLELLGREALTRRFYRTLERVVRALAEGASGRATIDERRSIALLYVSRLLFLSFLEAKGWLDGNHGFLASCFEACLAGGGDYQRRVLLPLFFGTLNTVPAARARAARQFGRVPFLNGGLFARTPLERRCASVRLGDEQLGLVHGELLARYRFSAREESIGWSEVAIDPEMLGKAFESLMASGERRASGAFYTPQAIVERVTMAALERALAGADEKPLEQAIGGLDVSAPEAARLRERISRLRVLDPACGSGAFLVHSLERIADLLRRLGDARTVSEIRRAVLTRSIFGVDVNPTAAWLCELRLWLSVVIESDEEDPLRVPPLPNLDHHVQVGDALTGRTAAPHGRAALGKLRERYARATGARKARLARALDREERNSAIDAIDAELSGVTTRRRDLVVLRRSPDLFGDRHQCDAAQRARLASLRTRARQLRLARAQLASGGALPFSFAWHFADVAGDGGFDIIVGNPPWVRLHNIPARMRSSLREEYFVFRRAAWAQGAEDAAAGSGFAAQVDLSALFVERSLALLRDGGMLALLLPMKLWRSLAGGGVRRLLLGAADVEVLEDWSESPAAFDAAVYPSLLVARRRATSGLADQVPVRSGDALLPLDEPKPEECTTVAASTSSTRQAHAPHARPPAIDCALHRRTGSLRWPIARAALPLDDSPGSPWLLAPGNVRAGFERLSRAGVCMHATPFGRPTLGVKCGCNGAFIVTLRSSDPDIALVTDGTRERQVESALLRPLVRGETLAAWVARPTEHILWTHSKEGAPLDRLPPLAGRWLSSWRGRLAARADARGSARWWSLFRTDAAMCDRPRIVWGDFGKVPRAAVLPGGDPTVPLNSCYVVRCHDALDADALAALLNSPVAAAWLALLAEPARGGYKRYLGWTMARFPIPREWEHARATLAPLAWRARAGDVPSQHELAGAAVRAYRLRMPEIAPLLAWASR
ncbi:MAG TPA: DNA methyltransferase [Gemmatimonadaceae bacterium]|nr:DNA methyltransferase [Gemmatimonadaceae bacterium]